MWIIESLNANGAQGLKSWACLFECRNFHYYHLFLISHCSHTTTPNYLLTYLQLLLPSFFPSSSFSIRREVVVAGEGGWGLFCLSVLLLLLLLLNSEETNSFSLSSFFLSLSQGGIDAAEGLKFKRRRRRRRRRKRRREEFFIFLSLIFFF